MICRLEKIHQWRGRAHNSLLQHLFPIHRESKQDCCFLETSLESGRKYLLRCGMRHGQTTSDVKAGSGPLALLKRRRRIVFMFIRRQIARSRNRSATIEDVNAGASSCNTSRPVLNRLC